ncbi:hypothetical protein [Mycobacterium sp. 94-17]|uniref:hypothetical protein n=1 Tax=Mycobacterium sp. 94-17 TaxID=2986147 RepID=UPI002D1F0630|nr:hypothetical protein [Mycobacterium sp. 94-17]MEB4211538.1 hypothetical protein [Mycobacterium sp. 94-17]
MQCRIFTGPSNGATYQELPIPPGWPRNSLATPGSIAFSMSALIGVGGRREKKAAAIDPTNFAGQVFDGATFCGSATQVVDELGRYAELGVSRVYVRAFASMARGAGSFELLSPPTCSPSSRGW